jgi:hypothetical protein
VAAVAVATQETAEVAAAVAAATQKIAEAAAAVAVGNSLKVLAKHCFNRCFAIIFYLHAFMHLVA